MSVQAEYLVLLLTYKQKSNRSIARVSNSSSISLQVSSLLAQHPAIAAKQHGTGFQARFAYLDANTIKKAL